MKKKKTVIRNFLTAITLFVFITPVLAQNTKYGTEALQSNTTGNYNSALGYRALYKNTGGLYNTSVGHIALYSNTTGKFNTGVGHQSLYANTTGSQNTAIGSGSLQSNTTGYANAANGFQALYANTTGFQNTAVGNQSLQFNTSGNTNTAVGGSALYKNITGNFNTAVGGSALAENTVGTFSVAMGYEALQQNTTGSYNTAVGVLALTYNTTGIYNTALGNNALYGNTVGVNNTANGGSALSQNTIGNYNTGVGYQALYSNTTGSNNTALGYSAGVSSGGLTNATAIGYNAKVSASNAMVLGNSAVKVGIGTSAPAYQLQLSTNSAAKPSSNVWTIASDRRLKKDITAFKDGLEVLQKIEPVWFTYTGEAGMPANEKAVGIIAQEMQKIAPYTVSTFTYQNASGEKKEYLDYDGNAVTYILINSIKQQQQQIDELKKLVATLTTSPSTSTTNIDLSDKNAVVLNQNVPNPFAEKTSIAYNIPQNVGTAQIVFYNASGQLVKTANITAKGKGQLNVFAGDLNNGAYTYTLVIDGKVIETKKMMKQ
jgi:hypothetical protein